MTTDFRPPSPDDPEEPTAEEQRWLAEQRSAAIRYLGRHGLPEAALPAEPELQVPPLFALFRPSPEEDAEVGWVITGEVPTDHVAARGATGPRAALRAFAKKWRNAASVIGQRHGDPDDEGLSPLDRARLAEGLFDRARLLWDLAEKDELWDE